MSLRVGPEPEGSSRQTTKGLPTRVTACAAQDARTERLSVHHGEWAQLVAVGDEVFAEQDTMVPPTLVRTSSADVLAPPETIQFLP